jgi:hypothetical protein
MNLDPVIFYSAYLEDGKKLAEYTSRKTPPNVGEIITILSQDVSGSFEVLDLSYKSSTGVETVILKVRPVSN